MNKIYNSLCCCCCFSCFFDFEEEKTLDIEQGETIDNEKTRERKKYIFIPRPIIFAHTGNNLYVPTNKNAIIHESTFI